MPSSTRSTTPEPSNLLQALKHTMSDPEYTSQDRKKPRRDSSAEPSIRRDSNRDTRRRRRKKRKAPVVTPAVKNDAACTRPDQRSRAPLSVRNEIIRFTSVPSEADLPASIVPPTAIFLQASSSKPSSTSTSTTTSLHPPVDITGHPSQGMPSTPNSKEQVVPVDRHRSGSLEDKVAQLEAELKSKNDLIVSHQALSNQIQQAVTCQVCLDLMYKPYALAPCGHLACHACLVNWFTAPPPDNRPASPAVVRKKTCPHCRAVVRERPVEVWGVKAIAQAMGKSGLLPNQLPVPDVAPESATTNADPWKDIFPKSGAASHRGLPWLFPGLDIDEDEIHVADVAPRGEDVGMLDMEDGGIYRCLDCMHELWGGVCSNCGRVYPGHMPEGDDEEGEERDALGWLEGHMEAEEVDAADDPGWMGLEAGEADDGGDDDRHHGSHAFRGPWNFLGTIEVDEEDEEDEFMYGRVGGFRDVDEDEGYESSFIDDDDDDGQRDDIAGYEDEPRIYEVDDDYRPVVDLLSDEDDGRAEFSGGEGGSEVYWSD